MPCLGWYRYRMNLRDYFFSLNKKGRARYAKRAGTTVNYIQNHLIRDHRKIPKLDLMGRLVAATNGKINYKNMLIYFYKQRKFK